MENTATARSKPARRNATRMLCEGAIMVALSQILSYIKLMELPNGGSLTPAMFPILLFAVRWGLADGLLAGFVFGLLQLMFDGAYAWGWQSMLLDYLVAFTPLGLAGLFQGKRWGIFAGTVLGCFARFVVHFISGVTIYRIYAPTEIWARCLIILRSIPLSITAPICSPTPFWHWSSRRCCTRR